MDTNGSLRKLYLFRNVFTQGIVGVANGKVAVGCKTKYLFFLLFGNFRRSPGLTEISVVPVSTRCLGVMVTSRPWMSIQQLSLRRAVHGTDTEMLPMNPSMISTGMPALSSISFTDCNQMSRVHESQ